MLNSAAVHVPWTRVLGGSPLNTVSVVGAHGPASPIQLLLKTRHRSDPGGLTHGDRRLRQMVAIGVADTFFASEMQ